MTFERVVEKDEESSIIPNVQDSDDEDDELFKDWSNIAKLSKSQAVVPKRGDKDYEPDGTNAQELLLYRAKKAMFDSISDAVRGTVVKNQIKAYYVPQCHLAFISNPKGNFMHTMGKVDRNGTCWLTFYEFVYLAERGTITPYFKRSDRESHELDPLLSIQDLYLLFRRAQESDEFAVFAHLKRLGFVVFPSRLTPKSEQISHTRTVSCKGFPQSIFNLGKAIFTFFSVPTYHPLQYHLTRYTTSSQIYESLKKLVPHYVAPKTLSDLEEDRFEPTRDGDGPEFTFDIWKPRGTFKKKDPGPPDFQVLVFNKNSGSSAFPTYPRIRQLFRSVRSTYEGSFTPGQNATASGSKKVSEVPKRPLPHVEQQRRLKKGYRSFILAVMDDGLISFVKLTESDFGSEDVWFKSNGQGNKKRFGAGQPKQRNAKKPLNKGFVQNSAPPNSSPAET
ncbi:LAFA_0E10110g1_1 [Lachancea sp. 'fantastica']|nr:LAFA_0E10110g1_1 [Lachancea sp. 'fantastica']